MSVSWYACVICDSCGAPAGGVDDLRENTLAALHRARQLGYVRVRDYPGTRPVPGDLCPTCAKATPRDDA